MASEDFFSGCKALITGSGRGIGRAVAMELAERGVSVLVHYNKNAEAAFETKSRIEKYGVEAWVYQANLCDTAETMRFLNEVLKEHDDLDFFIANAASTSFKNLSDLSESNIRKTFDLVITSFLLSVQKLSPLLKKKHGKILAVSGIDTIRFCPGHGLLASAKSALETLVKYLSVELAGDGIGVKCVNPGLVASDSTKLYLGEAFEPICRQADAIAPQGGVATPEKVAKMIVSLLHPDNDWMGGETVYANGGLSFLLPGLAK